MTNPTPSTPQKTQLTKAGIGLLKRIVFDETTVAADNRRADERSSVAGEVDVRVVDPQGQDVLRTRVFIRDLSKGGCGLWSRVAMPVGFQVIINFPAAANAAPTLKCGKVQHCRGQSGSGFAIGVKFIDDSQSVI